MNDQYAVGRAIYAETGPAQVREPQVYKKLGALGASMELLEKDLMALEDRLRPVLGPDVPMPAGDEKNKLEGSAPLASDLQVRIMHAEHLRNIVGAILSRLEI